MTPSSQSGDSETLAETGADAAPVPTGRPAQTDRMFLHAIPFYARHGVLDAERELGQRFVVDVDWWYDTRPAAWADDDALSISHQQVHAQVSAVVADEPVRLIETLAERIATRLIDHFPLIDQVRVVVHKPGAPVPGVFGDLGVDIIRRR